MVASLAEPVTVHTSWRGLGSALLSPTVLLAYAAVLLSAGGTGPVASISLLVGLGLAGVGLFDYPHRTEFSHEGIRRVCLLRTQLLPWADVVAIERAPGSVRSAIRQRGDDTPKVATGGLVARGLGRRRYLLTDRIESQGEYDRLRELLESLDVATSLRAGRPNPDVPPTDLYRPSRRSGNEERT